ncbi:MAG TPA: class I tRNA ligase family protein, partial [Caldisericia bacterium]|nr:class I tRNA ligase family protein [Caldisericia bacterium]
MNKFYVTTPIYYVNDEPHIGHLYTTTIADIIARAKRKMGYDVLFSTGTDENADKVKRVADEKGIDTKIFVDNLSESFKKTFLDFNISFDRFIRTT